MSWIGLVQQFCLELAFGVSLGLVLLARAPLGLFFFRLMGTVALAPLLAAALLPPFLGDAPLVTAPGVAALAGALAFPIASGPVRARWRALAQGWTTACTAVALWLAVRRAPAVEGAGAELLCALSALATGCVAGGVGLAMVVGHWYLTVPQLPIAWLQRLNRYTILAMLGSLALLVTTCVYFRDELANARSPLLGPWGLLQLGARVATGILLPLVFAWMTAGSLSWRNTRSATGILYASTVLVLIGTAVSVSLQRSYGIPL